MNIPRATYRIQFNPDFGFAQAQEITEYLAQLGISHLYASPIFEARTGSAHGYDVVDPNRINPELGTGDDFEQLVQTLKRHRLGWLQDIVPNHMAFDSRNYMLMDVLENGPDSEYFNFFDIEWSHPYEKLKGKVLAPFLGKFYGHSLEKGEIKLSYGEDGFQVAYYQFRFPLRLDSYIRIFDYRLNRLKRAMSGDHPDYIKLLGVLYALKTLPAGNEGHERQEMIRFIKRMLKELYEQNGHIRTHVDENIEIFNGKEGEPESFNLLDKLLAEQYYRLAFWKVGTEEINYRRFFTVNELISVRMQDEAVFQKTHILIARLVKEGKMDGVRIDHIDGLYHPYQYLKRLRNLLGDVYITVEKILEFTEELPKCWPVQGTTGYDFLNYLNGIFCKRENESRFDRIYRKFADFRSQPQRLTYEKKRLIIGKHMAGDVDNLAHLLAKISERYRYGNDFTLYGLRRSLVETLTFFSVYRTYISTEPSRDHDSHYIKEAVQKAREIMPDFENELNFIEKVLLLQIDDFFTKEEKEEWLHFVMRFQQITGALMAKGFEDTFLYSYNRLLSLNEVGGNPAKFGISRIEFHYYNKKRAAQWLYSMNATATHDTKRGEDVRARLNVLSEIPGDWQHHLQIWRKFNRRKKQKVNGLIIPDENDEYFLYQTLLGAYPFQESELQDFPGRIKEYVVKAVREAKVHTAWLKPDTAYENAFLSFIDEILTRSPENTFWSDFLNFQKKIAFYGIFNSLSQTLLKMTAPGVPDFYQGSELWDLSLVDPDNRRPVDFQLRMNFLNQLQKEERDNPAALLKELLANKEDGRIKLYLIYKTLQILQTWKEIFQSGTYFSLDTAGQFKDYLIAFGRKFNQQTALVIAPRFLTDIIGENEFPLGMDVWQNTQILLPEDFTGRESFTNARVSSRNKRMFVGELLNAFPVALLKSE